MTLLVTTREGRTQIRQALRDILDRETVDGGCTLASVLLNASQVGDGCTIPEVEAKHHLYQVWSILNTLPYFCTPAERWEDIKHIITTMDLLHGEMLDFSIGQCVNLNYSTFVALGSVTRGLSARTRKVIRRLDAKSVRLNRAFSRMVGRNLPQLFATPIPSRGSRFQTHIPVAEINRSLCSGARSHTTVYNNACVLRELGEHIIENGIPVRGMLFASANQLWATHSVSDDLASWALHSGELDAFLIDGFVCVPLSNDGGNGHAETLSSCLFSGSQVCCANCGTIGTLGEYCVCGNREEEPENEYSSMPIICDYEDADFTFLGTKSNDFPRYLGVEIEVSSMYDTGTYNQVYADKTALRRLGVSTKHDGSIKDETGREFTIAPRRGSLFKETVLQVTSILRKYSGEIQDDVGIHMHVDVRDFQKGDFDKLLALWVMVEPQIYSCVATHRQTYSHPFCRRIRERLETVSQRYFDSLIKHYIISEELDSFTHQTRYSFDSGLIGMRYYGLNMYALSEHGTVEFRLMETTLEAEKIIDMAYLLSRIVVVAKNRNRTLIENMYNTPEGDEYRSHLAFDMLGNKAKNVLRKYSDRKWGI